LTAFVLDNSVTMRWCFENASTPYAEEVLEQLLVGQQAHVPVLWLYEVVSVLAKAQRSGSITADKAHGFLEDIRSLNITVDDESFGHIFGDVHKLAVEHGLSGYDAAYLELAIRQGLPLATLDEDLEKAARIAGVELFQPA
jgi:predicted nucleic acid-binding protein